MKRIDYYGNHGKDLEKQKKEKNNVLAEEVRKITLSVNNNKRIQ